MEGRGPDTRSSALAVGPALKPCVAREDSGLTGQHVRSCTAPNFMVEEFLHLNVVLCVSPASPFPLGLCS